MEPLDGTPGSGWDFRLDTPEREALNLPPGPLDSGPGPSAGQRPTSEAHPSATRGKLEGDDRARASGEASGSGSGSPDENVNKRSNPPSPRDNVPASPEAASARAGDDSDLMSSAPSSPLPRRIPAAFEQRRRDALAAKQRRLDGIIGRISSSSGGRQTSGDREGQSRHRTPGETASADDALGGRRAAAAASVSPPRVRSSPARSKKTDSDVDEDWDDLLADATPLTRQTQASPPRTKTPSSAPWRAFEPTPEPAPEPARAETEATSPVASRDTSGSTFAFGDGDDSTNGRAAATAKPLSGGAASFMAEEDTFVVSAEASASGYGTFTPRKPPPSPFPSTPENGADGRRASPAMDKVAAARRIMAAASPARRLSPSAAREPVTNLVFSPPPPPRSASATSTPRPSRPSRHMSPLAGTRRPADAPTEASPSGSASATPDARKRAAARRIMLAAAARKASAGVSHGQVSPSPATNASSLGPAVRTKPTPFESPVESPVISPIFSPADASPAEPIGFTKTVSQKNPDPEHKKPLAARGLGSALEANADSSSARGSTQVDASTQDTLSDNGGGSAAVTEPTFENASGASDVVRAEEPPEPAPRSEGPTPKEEEEEEEEGEEPVFETRVSETRDTETRVSETHEARVSEPADAFAFDAPKHVENSARPEVDAATPFAKEDDSPYDVDRYDTDAGYGTALDTQSGFAASLEVPATGVDDAGDDTAQETRGGGVPTRGTRGLDSRRATRVALERAEMLAMKLEENEFLREALETRVAEAERAAEAAVARKQSATGDQLDRLREEADRNAYLRRLLKKAEQRRGEARAREREASAKFEALQSSAHRDAAAFALRLDRYEAESRGARRRVGAEKARNQALERALSRANVELAEQHRRRKSASQLLGMAFAAVVVLVLRVLAGKRDGALETAGGYRGGREAYVADAAARAANAARAAPASAAGFGPAV